MTAADLVPLPVVLPLLAAGVKFALGPRHPLLQRFISLGTLAAVLVIAAVLLVAADQDGPQVVAIGDWAPPIGITLVADRLSALLLVVSAAVTLAVLVYSYGQGTADEDEALPLTVFHPTFLVLVAGVSDAFLAGDLFNLYVGFEILLVASYVLITLGGTVERIRAGTTYVMVSLLSSTIFLAAIALVYAATGTLNLAQLAQRLDALPDDIRLALQVGLLVAFAIKAAVFPLSAWLPDSYPTAPAQVTAVFAGLLTKVGVYAMIRTETLLFPEDRVGDVLMVVALLTMVVGILGAVAQTDIKRLLSFTLVSHIGYMVFGIGLGSQLGMTGAVFYVVHHITVQTTLFLVTGLIERSAGSTSMNRIGGLAKMSPILGVLFFIPAMNLAGIPPFSGFVGKLGLLEAGVQEHTALGWILVAGSVVTSLLTLYAIAKVWARAFWRSPRVGVHPGADDEDPSSSAPEVIGQTLGGKVIPPNTDFPRSMVGATTALVVLGLAYTALAGPLMAYSDRASAELRERTPYVETTLGLGGRR